MTRLSDLCLARVKKIFAAFHESTLGVRKKRAERERKIAVITAILEQIPKDLLRHIFIRDGALEYYAMNRWISPRMQEECRIVVDGEKNCRYLEAIPMFPRASSFSFRNIASGELPVDPLAFPAPCLEFVDCSERWTRSILRELVFSSLRQARFTNHTYTKTSTPQFLPGAWCATLTVLEMCGVRHPDFTEPLPNLAVFVFLDHRSKSVAHASAVLECMPNLRKLVHCRFSLWTAEMSAHVPQLEKLSLRIRFHRRPANTIEGVANLPKLRRVQLIIVDGNKEVDVPAAFCEPLRSVPRVEIEWSDKRQVAALRKLDNVVVRSLDNFGYPVVRVKALAHMPPADDEDGEGQ